MLSSEIPYTANDCLFVYMECEYVQENQLWE